MKKSLFLSLSLLLSLSAFAQQYVLKTESITGLRPVTPPTIEVPGDGTENGGEDNSGGPNPETPVVYQCNGSYGGDPFIGSCNNGKFQGYFGGDSIKGTCENNNYFAKFGGEDLQGVCNETINEPAIPTVYQCDGVIGRDSFSGTCNNGTLTGSLGRDVVTGTCSNFDYHAIQGRNESTGTCNDLSILEEPEQPAEVDLSYSSTHSYIVGGRAAGDMTISYDHQNKVVSVSASNTTGRPVTITSSNGYSGDIQTSGGTFAFPFRKGDEIVYIEVYGTGRIGTISTENGDVEQLNL